MHNFHRVREALLRKRKRNSSNEQSAVQATSSTSNAASVANTEVVNENDEDGAASADDDNITSNLDTQYYDPWEQRERSTLFVAAISNHIFRSMSPQTISCIYTIEAQGMVTICGEAFVRVHIVGQAFLLQYAVLTSDLFFMYCSQIRLLMSAGILYTAGFIPLELVDIALETRLATPLPLAPAEGLILTGSAYARNVNEEVRAATKCVKLFYIRDFM